MSSWRIWRTYSKSPRRSVLTEHRSVYHVSASRFESKTVPMWKKDGCKPFPSRWLALTI